MEGIPWGASRRLIGLQRAQKQEYHPFSVSLLDTHKQRAREGDGERESNYIWVELESTVKYSYNVCQRGKVEQKYEKKIYRTEKGERSTNSLSSKYKPNSLATTMPGLEWKDIRGVSFCAGRTRLTRNGSSIACSCRDAHFKVHMSRDGKLMDHPSLHFCPLAIRLGLSGDGD